MDVRADPLTVACIQNTMRPRTGRRCLVSSLTMPTRTQGEGVAVGYLVVQNREGWYFSYAEFDKSVGRGVARNRLSVENDALLEFTASARDKVRQCCAEGVFTEYGAWDWPRPRLPRGAPPPPTPPAPPQRPVADLERELTQARQQYIQADAEKQDLQRQVDEKDATIDQLTATIAVRDETIANLQQQINALRAQQAPPPPQPAGKRGVKYGYIDRNTTDPEEMGALFLICQYATENPDASPATIARWLDTNHPNLAKRGHTGWDNAWGKEVIRTAKTERCADIMAQMQ